MTRGSVRRNLLILLACALAVGLLGLVLLRPGKDQNKKRPPAGKPGTARGTLEPLRIADGALEVGIRQDGRLVPREGRRWRLRPEPFALHLRGEVKLASYYVTEDPGATAELEKIEKSGKPLVFFKGTGMAIPPTGNLSLAIEPMTFFEASPDYFKDRWGTSPKEAIALAESLRQGLGVTPRTAEVGHGYFASEGETGGPGYRLR